MKLHILSDLHLEHSGFVRSPVEANVVILAGDIHTKARASLWASEAFDIPTVMVAGNHDSYGSSLQRSLRKLKETAYGCVRFLERDVFIHDGIRFIGCTGWTDFRSFGHTQLNMSNAQGSMNDYRMIRYEPSYRRLRASDTQAIADESKQWLLEQNYCGYAPCALVAVAAELARLWWS